MSAKYFVVFLYDVSAKFDINPRGNMRGAAITDSGLRAVFQRRCLSGAQYEVKKNRRKHSSLQYSQVMDLCVVVGRTTREINFQPLVTVTLGSRLGMVIHISHIKPQSLRRRYREAVCVAVTAFGLEISQKRERNVVLPDCFPELPKFFHGLRRFGSVPSFACVTCMRKFVVGVIVIRNERITKSRLMMPPYRSDCCPVAPVAYRVVTIECP
jgi:hypothetical protein